jgi:glycine cleavage system aminomethyltransferase T
MGPRAPEILTRVSRAPLGAVPFGGIVEANIGYATCWAMRRSYMGEAGFELFVPTEFAVAVYETLFAAGADFGLRDVGYYAVESLRLEKAYRAWGRELGPNINPFQAGLGFAVRLNKPDFIGRDALVATRTQPLTKRIVAFTGPAPADQLAWGGESILAGGQPVGEVTSAAYGATLGGLVALGLVSSAGEPIDQAWLDGRKFEIDIAGEVVPMRASLKPFYDPDGLRMRAA